MRLTPTTLSATNPITTVNSHLLNIDTNSSLSGIPGTIRNFVTTTGRWVMPLLASTPAWAQDAAATEPNTLPLLVAAGASVLCSATISTVALYGMAHLASYLLKMPPYENREMTISTKVEFDEGVAQFSAYTAAMVRWEEQRSAETEIIDFF